MYWVQRHIKAFIPVRIQFSNESSNQIDEFHELSITGFQF